MAASDFNNIPDIWNSQIWLDPGKVTKKNNDVAMFDNAPYDVTAWSFFWRFLISAVVWVCVAALLFGTLSATSGLVWDWDKQYEIQWILLPIVWFIVWFVCNLVLALLYNIFLSKRYYSFSKMFWLIFTASLLILPLFIAIFATCKFVLNWTNDVLYLVLKFHIIFMLYISLNLMDFMAQPNYSASSLIWNTIWFVLATFLALILPMDIIYITISAVVSYASIALWAWIWDAIYYKFYEWWNNPFYLPSLSELREERKKEEIKKSKEEEDVNVEIW